MAETEAAAKGERGALSRIYAWVRVVAGVAILVLLALQAARDWPAVRELAVPLRVGPLVLSGVAVAASLLLLAGAWQILLRGAGVPLAGARRFWLRAWLVSYFYRWVPGRVLAVAERLRAGTVAGVRVLDAGALMVVESVVSACAGLVVSSLVLPARLGGRLGVLLLVGGFALAVVVGVPLALSSGSRLSVLRRLLGGRPMPRLGAGTMLAALSVDVVAWALMGFAFHLFALSFIPLPWTMAPLIVGTFALAATIALLVVVAPAGLGVREGLLTLALSDLAPAGVAAAIAIASRAWMTLVELVLVGGALCLRSSPRR